MRRLGFVPGFAGESSGEMPMGTAAPIFLKRNGFLRLGVGLGAVFADSCHDRMAIDGGSNVDLSFATTEHSGRRERGPARTKLRITI